MKFIALILSIVMMSMVVMPCTDGNQNIENKDASIIYDCSDSHNHSDEDKDDCTPFCICQCCGISIIIPHLMVLDHDNSENIFSYSYHYSFHYNHDYSYGIWQPPMVS